MLKILSILLFSSILFSETETVAVSYFDNTSDIEEFNPLSKGLADMLITDLSNIKSINIVEREKLESLLKEIELGDSDFINKETAQKLGEGLGATYMLTGSFLIIGETMRIDASLVDVGSGEVVMAEEITGEKDTFFELEKDLVNKLIDTFDISLSKSESRKVKKIQTESFESFNSYSSALVELDEGNFKESIKLLEQATEFDEDFDIAWEKLDEVIELLEIIEKTRGTGLSIDLINSIEKLSSGKQDECIEFNDYYSSLCYSVYDYVSTDYYYNDKNFLIENWKEFLLIHQPKTEEEGEVKVTGKQGGNFTGRYDEPEGARESITEHYAHTNEDQFVDENACIRTTIPLRERFAIKGRVDGVLYDYKTVLNDWRNYFEGADMEQRIEDEKGKESDSEITEEPLDDPLENPIG